MYVTSVLHISETNEHMNKYDNEYLLTSMAN